MTDKCRSAGMSKVPHVQDNSSDMSVSSACTTRRAVVVPGRSVPRHMHFHPDRLCLLGLDGNLSSLPKTDRAGSPALGHQFVVRQTGRVAVHVDVAHPLQLDLTAADRRSRVSMAQIADRRASPPSHLAPDRNTAWPLTSHRGSRTCAPLRPASAPGAAERSTFSRLLLAHSSPGEAAARLARMRAHAHHGTTLRVCL